MPNALKREWKSLTSGSPGSRFQDRYAIAKKDRQAGNWTHHLLRIVRLFIATAALVVGMVLAVMPGPAVLFFFIAGGLLATESKLVARFLDWTEVELRKAGQWAQRSWQQLSVAGKMGLLTVATVLVVGAAFVMYHVMIASGR